MFDRVIDAILIFGFPIGVLVGYMWRDRISRARRARHLAELNKSAREKRVRELQPKVDVEIVAKALGASRATGDRDIVSDETGDTKKAKSKASKTSNVSDEIAAPGDEKSGEGTGRAKAKRLRQNATRSSR
jgi:hypothetical protein